MKRNLLILWATLTGVIFLSGCYTKFIEPVVRQEIYEQAESDTVIQENQSFDNYTFDSSYLNDYNAGYRDAYQDFLHSNLWYGYSPNSRLFSPYRYGYYQNNSYFLGYYDPWSCDPFYDWDYYRYYSYYGGYYGGYYDPYYGWGGGGGYHGHGSHWYNNGGGGETVAEGRDQKKAEWQAKETTVSRSRGSDTGSSSDFQTTISYMPTAFQASSSTSASGTKTVTTVTGTGSSSQKARWSTKSATTGTTSNGEPVVGFQTTLVPAASQTTVIRQNTGSRTGTKTTYIKNSGSSRSSSNKQSSSRSKSSSSDNSSSTPSSSSNNSSSSGSSGSSSTPSSSTGSSTSSSGSSSSSSSSSGGSSSSSSSGSSRSSSPKASGGSSKDHHK